MKEGAAAPSSSSSSCPGNSPVDAYSGELVEYGSGESEKHAATKIQSFYRGQKARTMVGATLLGVPDSAKKGKAARSVVLQLAQEQAAEDTDALVLNSPAASAEESPGTYWTQGTRFNLAIGVVVLTNAIVLGAETDMADDYPMPFLVLEHVYCSIFVVELAAHLCVAGAAIYFGDKMNWLDFALVVLAVFDVWLVPLFGLNIENLKMMSICRMLRLTRLARLLRLFRVFKELTILIQGLLGCFRILIWAVLLLLIVTYISAIFVRKTVGVNDRCAEFPEARCSVKTRPYYDFNLEIGDQEELFGNMFTTMLTLFICITDGCGVDVIRPIVWESPQLVFFFLAFSSFTTFGIMNLIISIFTAEAMRTSGENEAEMLHSREERRRQVLVGINDAFSTMDTNEDGFISSEEFIKGIMDDVHIQSAFVELGLDKEENLFDRLDADRKGKITYDQFFEGTMLIMKGHETAKAKDMVGILMIMQTVFDDMKNIKPVVQNVLKAQPERRTTLKDLRGLLYDFHSELKKSEENINALDAELQWLSDSTLDGSRWKVDSYDEGP